MSAFTIDQIADAIYNGVVMTLAYDPDLDTLAEARRVNQTTGWTIEESLDDKIRGDVMRYENVRVSDDKLIAAHALATEWLQ